MNCVEYEDIMAKQSVGGPDEHYYKNENCEKDISLAIKTFPTFGHLGGKLLSVFPEMEEEWALDSAVSVVDLRTDKFGLEEQV